MIYLKQQSEGSKGTSSRYWVDQEVTWLNWHILSTLLLVIFSRKIDKRLILSLLTSLRWPIWSPLRNTPIHDLLNPTISSIPMKRETIPYRFPLLEWWWNDWFKKKKIDKISKKIIKVLWAIFKKKKKKWDLFLWGKIHVE